MKISKHILVFVYVTLASMSSFAQFKVPDKPNFQSSVYDYVSLFNTAEKKALEEKLIKYSDSTSTQIVIATIASTEGEDILYLGARWLERWGIGQAKEDNGILILLATEDRRISINTGYGVEHLLTDAMSKRIIERDIIPYFKQGDYVGGLDRGTDAIFEVMTGEYQAARTSSGTDFPLGLVIFLIIMFIIFLIAISASRRGGRKGGGRRYKDSSTGRDILEAIILSKAGRGSYRRSSGGFGGFGGSSGGGGFSGGFGGGSGGGGGASGGW